MSYFLYSNEINLYWVYIPKYDIPQSISGFVIDIFAVFGAWYRGLTTFPLHGCPVFGKYILSELVYKFEYMEILFLCF